MDCPKCKGEFLIRKGKVSIWFSLTDEGRFDVDDDGNRDTCEYIHREPLEEEKWVCLDCQYEEKIKEEIKNG